MPVERYAVVRGTLHLAALLVSPRRTSYPIRIGPGEAPVPSHSPGTANREDPMAVVRPGSDGSFRFERVTAKKPLRVRLESDAAVAEAYVTAPPGGDVHVDLRPTPGGLLRFRAEGPVARGYLQVQTATGNQPWRTDTATLHEFFPVAGAIPEMTSPPLPAGPTRWRLRFQDWTEVDTGRITTRSGEVEVRDGETVEVSWSPR